jgi:hypothetical protein
VVPVSRSAHLAKQRAQALDLLAVGAARALVFVDAVGVDEGAPESCALGCVASRRRRGRARRAVGIVMIEAGIIGLELRGRGLELRGRREGTITLSAHRRARGITLIKVDAGDTTAITVLAIRDRRVDGGGSIVITELDGEPLVTREEFAGEGILIVRKHFGGGVGGGGHGKNLNKQNIYVSC